ncbi:MAG: alpha/beta fold hydrolase [Cyanobacteria bacterium]|jgi:pimeloyl-ACP methyl ester carboxylesterase|nr:alpha/beta fold hydrolase [Cyanobacteria bacterium GSL.Bin1]
MRRLKKLIDKHFYLVIQLGLFYLLCCGLLWYYQERLIFFPSSVIETIPSDVQLHYEEVWLTVDPGQVHGWWVPSQSEQSPVLLYLHGNGSNLGDLVSRLQRFHQWGYCVFLIDYRGYGRSSGSFPNEKRVYEDAQEAWRYLTAEKLIPEGKIVIYGRSLGSAIAIELGVSHPEAAGLILESPFTSLAAMAKEKFPIPLFPLNWLFTQKFDSLAKVPLLQTPVLLIHGKKDKVVPPPMSRTLYKTISSPKTLVFIPEAGHNDLPIKGDRLYIQAVQDFIIRYAGS